MKKSTVNVIAASSSRKRRSGLPSMFMGKRRCSEERNGKINCYVRDIICLPKEWSDNSPKISIPRNAKRNLLAELGLVGKIEFTSAMSADDIKEEICKVFATPMGLTLESISLGESFPFTYLQRAGAGSRALCIPSVSSTFRWTGKQVSTLAKSGGTIYIQANIRLPNVAKVSCMQFEQSNKQTIHCIFSIITYKLGTVRVRS